MLTDHALTIKKTLTPENLEYLAMKANKLGMQGREIARVYTQEDSEGKHVYYETKMARVIDVTACFEQLK